MKTFSRHPYFWSLLVAVLAWAPLCAFVPEETAVKRVAAIFPIVAFTLALNYIGRTLFPFGGEGVRAVYEKHFNTILVGAVICNLLAAAVVTVGFKWGGVLLLIPLLWQGLSLPTGALMLPHISKELDEAVAAQAQEVRSQ